MKAMYMLCEPEFLLPIDFDTSLKDLCIRQGLNYGTLRNALSRSYKQHHRPVKIANVYFIEKVTLSKNV